MRELDADDDGRGRWLQCGLEVASGLRRVDPAVDRAVAWLGQPSLPFPPLDGPLRLIHNDLSPEHLLVAPAAYVGHEP